MKLLVFEYITGGGMAGEVLPSSLHSEGKIMLQALLDELGCLPDIEIWLMLDARCVDIRLPERANIAFVKVADDVQKVLRSLMTECDAFWPIAPETGGLLAQFAQLSIDFNKPLLLSSPKTVDLCADKWATYQCLEANNIPVVQTFNLADIDEAPFPECVIKPIDGVGCEGSHIVTNVEAFKPLLDQLIDKGHYIVQPYLPGKAISLSCLYKHGKAWLLTYNEQLIRRENKSFRLLGCMVNAPNQDLQGYVKLINEIAQALPELWGYIGIDLIENSTNEHLVLEINPRLTTSYSGVRSATGINVAKQILQMLTDDPILEFSRSQTIQINIQ